jgi:hypothetical protein
MAAASALLPYVLLGKTPIVPLKDVYIYYNLVAALERRQVITTLLSSLVSYQPPVPGVPLNGPTISCVIQPP